MTHRATIDSKFAYLSGDFGRDYAMKHFGLTIAELEAIVGRYTKGKRKGELRGAITWRKCVRGGWLSTGPNYYGEGRTSGHVVKPGHRFDHAIVDPWKGNKVLWNDNHKLWGWIPGETQAEYDKRNKQDNSKDNVSCVATSTA